MKRLLASEDSVRQAAEAIRQGKLVIVPTETVYGIAADALNPDAIDLLFQAKERPSENPLIVHIGSTQQISFLSSSWTRLAQTLADAFWPGPLTLVVEKSDNVPSRVTGGQDTVALRMPCSWEVMALCRLSETPLAIPSANRFMQLSPTSADHIDPKLASFVELLIDGGSCPVGVESTVVDCTSDSPVILRPGAIPRYKIYAAVGLEEDLDVAAGIPPHRSPGQYPRHYAPKTPIELVDHLEDHQPGLVFDSPRNPDQIQMPREAEEYAVRLYATLFDMDLRKLQKVFVEMPPEHPDWEAVRDRLLKASAPYEDASG
jgi:L-threonylcarbamoyladenylate synthase